jgi:hypothetical protein
VDKASELVLGMERFAHQRGYEYLRAEIPGMEDSPTLAGEIEQMAVAWLL